MIMPKIARIVPEIFSIPKIQLPSICFTRGRGVPTMIATAMS